MRRLRQREPHRCRVVKANRPGGTSGDYIPSHCCERACDAGGGITKAEDEHVRHGGALGDFGRNGEGGGQGLSFNGYTVAFIALKFWPDALG